MSPAHMRPCHPLRRSGAILLALVALLSACKGNSVAPCTMSVSVAPSPLDIHIGGTGALAAVVQSHGGCSGAVSTSWSSSDSGVAQVSSTGTVTGVAAGTATITVAASSGEASASGSATVTVTAVPVASVAVSPAPDSVMVGHDLSLSAQTLDSVGHVLTGRSVAWSSSDTTVATVSSGGVVTGVGAGTATITATSEGKTGTASVTVLMPRFAYYWGDQSTAASYTPDGYYSYNSSGGAITVTRTGTGRYVAKFAGLGTTGSSDWTKQTVLVSAYGATAVCGVTGWHDSGSDLLVGIYCDSPAGTPMDSQYTVLVVGAGSLQGVNAFLWTSSTASDYAPDPQGAWNSAGAPMRVTQQGSNRLVDLGVTPADVSKGKSVTWMTTPYGGAYHTCALYAGNPSGTTQTYQCVDAGGNITYGPFTTLMLQGGRPGKRAGFGMVYLRSQPSPAGPSWTQYNSSGGGVTITRLGTGRYRFVFAGLGRTSPTTQTETVIASSFAANPCTVLDWGGSPDLQVDVQCFDNNGAALDTQVFVLVVG